MQRGHGNFNRLFATSVSSVVHLDLLAKTLGPKRQNTANAVTKRVSGVLSFRSWFPKNLTL
jgi:hypothetical protein